MESSEPRDDSQPVSKNPALRFGRYTVFSEPDGSPCEIGRGAMGITYKATDDTLGRVVVLKLIQGSVLVNPEARRRFRHEARLTAQLNHPHIATVYDAGSEGGTDYYVMEFIDGEDALKRLRRDGPFSWQAVLSIGEQVAQALERAWEHKKMVHRDIKPANIMLLGTGGRIPTQPFVKVIDFGLARLLEPESGDDILASVPGIFKGTPAYASPEQCEHHELDTRSDIYSLGITLWHLLAGKPPFGGSAQQVMFAHISKLPVLSELTEVPPAFLDLLRRMLAKNREDRPGDPTALLHAFEGVRAALAAAASNAATPEEIYASYETAAPSDGGLGAFERLRTGDIFAENYRLVEEMPVAPGRRRFRAIPLAAGAAGEPSCLEIIDPQLWADAAACARLGEVINLLSRASWQPGLWSCSVVVADAARGLRFVKRAPAEGRTLLDEIRHRAKTPGRGEIRRWLDAVPSALDALKDAGFVPTYLCPGSFLMGDVAAQGASFDVLQQLFDAWNELFSAAGQTAVKAAAPPQAAASGSSPVPVLARLIYDLSGGALAVLDRSGYRPVAVWDENGNRALRRALNREFSDCRTFWNVLYDEGVTSGPAQPVAGAGVAAAAVSPVTVSPVIAPPMEPAFSRKGAAEPVTSPSVEMPSQQTEIDSDPALGWKNHLGMRFRPVPGTVVDFCIWPARVSDYTAFALEQAAAAGQEWRQPGFAQTPDHPVVGVSVVQAQAFCRWLSAGGKHEYRLPTDAEWSVAIGLMEGGSSSGDSRRFPWGSEWPPPRDAGKYAIRMDGYGCTAPVGSFRENAFGLYDLGGNVWEWCTDPVKTPGKGLGVLRGGSWNTASRAMALANARQVAVLDRGTNHFGFRVVAVAR